MAEITNGAIIGWRENLVQQGGSVSLATAQYVRTGHTVTGGSVTVDPNFPLSNLLDRRLSKVARLICTPVQDTSGGGNARWYYPTIKLRASIPYVPGFTNFAYNSNTFGLFNVDVRYPSIEPNVDFTLGWPGGYYQGVWINAWNLNTFGGSQFISKVPQDGSDFYSPRSQPQTAGYVFQNNILYCFDRSNYGSVEFVIQPALASTYAGLATNPGVAYLTVGRMWVGDSFIVGDGIDAQWKMKPIDPSVVNRSRGQQTYVDAYQRLRSLDFSISQLNDQQAFDVAVVGTNANGPSMLNLQLEAGTQGEVIIAPRLSMNASGGSPNGPFFADAGFIYGTVSPPGVEIDDQTSGYFIASGNVIESR